MKTYILIICFFIATPFAVCAQLSPLADTLQFTGKLMYMPDSTTVPKHSTFVFYGEHLITWSQKNGALIDSFEIRSVEGEWADQTNNGTLYYTVQSGQWFGQIRTVKVNKDVRVTIDLMDTKNQSVIKQEYDIQKIDNL